MAELDLPYRAASNAELEVITSHLVKMIFSLRDHLANTCNHCRSKIRLVTKIFSLCFLSNIQCPSPLEFQLSCYLMIILTYFPPQSVKEGLKQVAQSFGHPLAGIDVCSLLLS